MNTYEIWVVGRDVTDAYPASITEKSGRIIEVTAVNAASKTHVASFQPSWLHTVVGFVTDNELDDDTYSDIYGSIGMGTAGYGERPHSGIGYHDKDMDDVADEDDEPDTIASAVEWYICNGADFEMEIGRIFGLSWATLRHEQNTDLHHV